MAACLPASLDEEPPNFCDLRSKPMRIFLYEHICGGGLLSAGVLPSGSLLAEGRAMLTALAADFSSLVGVRVSVLVDARLERLAGLAQCEQIAVPTPREHATAFPKCVQASDWVVVIAPELDGALAGWCERARSAGGRLLGPSASFTRMAADKWLTHQALKKAGLPTPPTRQGNDWDPAEPAWPGPLVFKPRLGAGSQRVRLVDGARKTSQSDLQLRAGEIVQPFCAGVAASVAALAGPKQHVILPACRQRLSEDGSFAYLGGELPLGADLDVRARRLAARALEVLPGAGGYVGIDLVLGPAADGSDDQIIEINPRLTTSYVGYRASCRENLAGALLAVVEDRPCELSFSQERITFECDGMVNRRGEVDGSTVVSTGSGTSFGGRA